MFPYEITHLLASNLNTPSRCNFRQVCKSFNQEISIPNDVYESSQKLLDDISQGYYKKVTPSLSESASTNLYNYIKDKLAIIQDKYTRVKLLVILFNTSYKFINSKNTSYENIDVVSAYKTLAEEIYFGVGLASLSDIKW